MLIRQSVPELREHLASVFCCIRLEGAVVQVNLNLTQARVTVLRQPGDEIFVVLLSRIKIRMGERPALVITPAFHQRRI
jgi:hypothetical protein